MRGQLSSFKNNFNKKYYTYRYDLFAILFMELIICWIFVPIFYSGHIVFSDIDFPYNSGRYLEEIFGLWNSRWNTTTMLNIPRLLFILPSWLISAMFGFSGELFFKLFLFSILQISAFSMYLFCKRLISIYISPHFNLFMTLSLAGGSLLYALNPWVIVRIQHIYLLCGYALFPLMLKYFFNVFDPRFQTQLIHKYSVFRIRLYRRNIIDLMLLSLIVSAMSAAIHYLFYSIITVITFALLLYLKLFIVHFREGSLKRRAIFYNFFIKGMVFGLFLIAFSYYWMGPYAGSIIINAGISQNNINVLDTLSLFSRNSSIVNVLFLISYWWPMFDISTLSLSFYAGGFIILLIVAIGIVKYAWKNHILLLFTLMTLMFLIFATGVKTQILAGTFINVVTKIPVFGTIFRDPNKLIGLASAGYSILFVFGLNSIFSQIGENNINSVVFKLIIILVVSISFRFYIGPFYNHFFHGFYAPVAIPAEYEEVQKAFLDPDQADSRVLYLPISDNMTQAHTGVATPFWNKNPYRKGFDKATGDFHVYSSAKNTIFHHEGNPPALTYYINFLHFLLDQGLTNNFAEYLKPLGVNELAYHDEYLGHEGRQDFNLEILERQNGISKHYEDDIFTLYRLHNPPTSPVILEKAIHTPYGLSHLSTYMTMPNFNFSSTGVIFSSLQKKGYIDKVRPGDLIEAANYNDLWLSNLAENLYTKPFDFINEGNPFLGWSKTLVQTNDWLWYLRSQNIDNFPYDFTFGSGIAVTFASARLNVPVYLREKINGKKILDFDSMLRLDLFFKADNPHLFQVTANPIGPMNKIPLLHGEIIQGDPESIWQVARSGLIDAKENTPYQFKILISGRGTNKLHIKVRFFDEEMNELGMSYAVAPREEISFDAANFYSEYISPPGSHYMRFELQSFKRPEQKVYWWVHDIEILDLSEYKSENSLIVKVNAEKTEPHNLYMRVFKSRTGGLLSVSRGDIKKEIITEDPYINQFVWISLGEFDLEHGENTLVINNLAGFNAINILAAIPVSTEYRYQFPVERALSKGRVFFALEAENDFSYYGNIQSSRRYLHLSMGNAIASQSGVLSRKIDILKNGRYDLQLNLQGIPFRNRLHIEFRQADGSVYTQKTVEIDNEGDFLQKYDMIKYVPIEQDKNYTREIISSSGGKQFTEIAEVKEIPLVRGTYDLILRFESNAESLSSIEDLHYFDPSEVNVPSYLEDIFQEDCSDCESINEGMVQKELTEKKLTLNYDRTCSCDWFVYSSDKLNLEPDSEYLIMFEAKSEGIKKRHSKVMFLDNEDQIILTDFIPEVDESEKTEWNRYEYIVTAPEGSVSMLFQVWARGNKNKEGLFEIREYEIFDYSDLLKVDSLILIEQEDIDQRVVVDSISNNHTHIDSMFSKIWINNPSNSENLILFSQPVVPLWHLETSADDQRSDLEINAVSTAFFTRGNGEMQYKMKFRKHYYAGLIIFFFGFFIAWIFYYRSASPLPFPAVVKQQWKRFILFIKYRIK